MNIAPTLTATAPAAAVPYPRRWAALTLLALAQFVVVLDASIVNIALPSISHGLGLSATGLSWVINAYLITFGGLLLLGGRAADLLGRRATFLGGLLVFTAASFADGLAPSGGALIAARAVQGAAAAFLSPAALSLVTTLFPDRAERGKALGVWGAVAGSGAAAGVLFGGLLTAALSWSWIFFINVPVGLLAAALTPRLLPRDRSRVGDRSVDLAGALSVMAGLAALVYGLVTSVSAGWGSARTLVPLTAGLALLATFVAVETRQAVPLVPLRIVARRAVAVANVVMTLVGAAIVGLFFFLSLYMQQALGYGPLAAGLAQLPLAVTLIAAAGLAPRLAARWGGRPVLVAGLALLAAGMVWFGLAPVGGSFLADILGPSLLVGAGLGLTFVPLTVLAVSDVSDREAGLASGLINTTQQIGGALGLAVLTTVATGRTQGLAHATSHLPALVGGFQWAFLGGAGLAVLATVIALIAAPGAFPVAAPGALPEETTQHTSTAA